MNAVRRALAALQAWWLRLFLLGIVLSPFAKLPVWADLMAFAVLIALSLVRAPRRDDAPPASMECPVRGRWAALNSPADKVPSHGVRAYGQAFAIDIAHARPPGHVATLGWGLRQRRPEGYPSFGQPVYAAGAGTVVAVADRQRDHRARSTWPGILFMMTIEGLGRELGGARYVVGNHVIIEHGAGVYSLYAHLRRESATVRVGDRAEPGQQLGEVGNTGNTSEPHLHFQLMDDRRPSAAAGLAFRWRDIAQDPADTDPSWTTGDVREEITPGLPASGQVFVARS